MSADTNPTDIEWGENAHEAVIVPVDRMDRATLQAIPIPVHSLLVNIRENGVDFSGGLWDEETRDLWLNQLPDDEAAFENSAMFYVRPDRVIPARSERVPTPQAVVDKIIAEWDMENMDMNALLLSVVAAAREGLVENPF